MDKKKYDGNFTVEATFIFPIVFLLFLIFINLSFYLYDYCKIMGIINQGLNRSLMVVKHDVDMEESRINYANMNQGLSFYYLDKDFDHETSLIVDYLWNEFDQGLLISKIEDIKVSINWHHIELYLEYSEEFPLPNILKVFNQKNKEHIIVKRKSNHQPTQYIRLIDFIVETGEGMKAMESVKETLVNLLGQLK